MVELARLLLSGSFQRMCAWNAASQNPCWAGEARKETFPLRSRVAPHHHTGGGGRHWWVVIGLLLRFAW